MALVVTVLKNDLISAFYSMNNGDDKVFSEKISAAAKKYAESGSIATVDTGSVSAGVYAGAGTGKITVNDSVCEKIVYAACMDMRNLKTGGNEHLAAELASGIHSMVTAGEVKTDVKGMVTPPSSSPVTLNGTAKGKLTGISAPMQTAFLSTFTAMDGMKSGGDDYLAQQIAVAVDAYLKDGVVNTKGDSALSGSAGTGKMT